MKGEVVPLVKSRGAGWRPTRPLGGWLMTYGKIGPDGGVVPTVDRDDQIMDAARELGHINWEEYIKGGFWNDTHIVGPDGKPIIVGVPTTLEFHAGDTELSKSHGKVGFWTTGHLFDRTDPQSWQKFLPPDKWPSPGELDRADHFWSLSQLLKGTPRPLGLSAEGSMALSPCRKRVLYAKVTCAAVCEVPVNPDTTLEPMELAFLRKGMVGADACRNCKCPKGARCTLAKAVTAGGAGTGAVVKEDLEGVSGDTKTEKMEHLIRQVRRRFKISRREAIRWCLQYANHKERQSA